MLYTSFEQSHLMQVIATPYWKPASKHYDMACGPTGLEEMVHTDPVCAQVGFPFSGLLNSVRSLTDKCTHMVKNRIPFSYSLYLWMFFFSAQQLSPLM